MRVIAKSTLEDFWIKYPDSEQSLRAWYREAKRAIWKAPSEIKEQYRSASILKKSRVVFNIAGNKHRMLAEVLYAIGIIYIKFVGTHRQYDAIVAEDYDGDPIQGH